ncbi:MAG: FMN-binding protein [Desulfatibacillum sp.]|nr:FMN-binding protein [Desulfatibacillum sp.]
MREMVKMIVVITLLAAFSGGLLAVVRDATAPQIESQKLKFVQGPTIQSIFAEADNLDTVLNDRFKIVDGDTETNFFIGVYDGKPSAVAFEASAVGFGGPLGVMVAVNLDTDEMIGVGVTTSAETPGIGSRAKDEPELAAQFTGLPLLQPFSVSADGGDIDAISGATVTSKAVVAAVTSAGKIYENLKPQILEKVGAFAG